MAAAASLILDGKEAALCFIGTKWVEEACGKLREGEDGCGKLGVFGTLPGASGNHRWWTWPPAKCRRPSEALEVGARGVPLASGVSTR